MKTLDLDSQIEAISKARLDRRKFFRQAGMFGFGAAASGLVLSGTSAKAQETSYQKKDSIGELLTAFLIAEDLATTFYYNGLTGAVIQDPNLAGPGGSAVKVTASGNVGNVNYLQAALNEEIEHANYFRTNLNKITSANAGSAQDPYQTFYFPAGTFDTLSSFLGILDALENAFIGAYLLLVQELAYKAVAAQAGTLTGADAMFGASYYAEKAQVAASILGIESEHRVLGRVIGNVNPANNLNYEQLDGLQSIFNGPKSAVVALTPFLSASTGPGYSLATALAYARHVEGTTTTTGGQP